MIQRVALIAAMALAVSPAHALSCRAPSVSESYTAAAEADELYVVVLGTVELREPAPERPVDNEAQDLNLPGRIAGRALSARGFETPVTRDVDVVSQCQGPWCGQFPQSSPQAIMFVKVGDTGDWTLELSPCVTWYFEKPATEDIARIEACRKSGTCEE